MSDDHLQFVTDPLLEVGVERFGDIYIEPTGRDGPSGRVGDGNADNDVEAVMSN